MALQIVVTLAPWQLEVRRLCGTRYADVTRRASEQ